MAVANNAVVKKLKSLREDKEESKQHMIRKRSDSISLSLSSHNSSQSLDSSIPEPVTK